MASITGDLPNCEQRVVEALRDKIAKVAGVTLFGNRLTVRWTLDGQLVDVHMIIAEVTTPVEAAEMTDKSNRYRAMFDKFDRIDLAAEFHYAEHGEYPK